MPRFAATTTQAAKFPLNDVEVDIEIAYGYTTTTTTDIRGDSYQAPQFLLDSGRTELLLDWVGLGWMTSLLAQPNITKPRHSQRQQIKWPEQAPSQWTSAPKETSFPKDDGHFVAPLTSPS
ncbi:hypothetical protein PG995_015556 [Apiospora arundinis]|uniref:Peptidase A1 domain-containing protein n=1 Tax=Apiospora arundinis TaxID=335852 RepID=A0ABR2IGB8_9PEZI